MQKIGDVKWKDFITTWDFQEFGLRWYLQESQDSQSTHPSRQHSHHSVRQPGTEDTEEKPLERPYRVKRHQSQHIRARGNGSARWREQQCLLLWAASTARSGHKATWLQAFWKALCKILQGSKGSDNCPLKPIILENKTVQLLDSPRGRDSSDNTMKGTVSCALLLCFGYCQVFLHSSTWKLALLFNSCSSSAPAAPAKPYKSHSSGKTMRKLMIHSSSYHWQEPT